MILSQTIFISRMLIMLALICANEAMEVEEEEKEEDISFLSELPLQQLLAQKKNLPKELKLVQELQPISLPLIGKPKPKMTGLKGFHNIPIKKTLYAEEDYDDDKEWVHKKTEKNHSHDILNTSLTVLSYLAFGGYLLCMIVNSLRQNNRSQMASYPPLPGQVASPPTLTALLQQYGTRKPIRIKFPAVTVHQGKKKRRKRSLFHKTKNSTRVSEDNFSFINAIDYIEIVSQYLGDGN